jgi:hypothetical protein
LEIPPQTQCDSGGEEEDFGHGIQSRCELALLHYRPLLNVPGVSVQTHETTLYNSIYRFDDEMVINTHVWGANAYLAPTYHLRRLDGGTLFDTYARSFDAVWATSKPVQLSEAGITS